MKYSVVQTRILPVLFLVMGLAACDDPEVISKEFNGEWKSTACEEGTNSRSFLQLWKIVDDTQLVDTIKVWDQPNCPSNLPSTKITLKGGLLVFHDDISVTTTVSAVCKEGKAKHSRLTLISYINSKNETETIKNEKDIRSALISENLGNILPKFNLICLDSAGKIHTGDLSTGNGFTSENRPKEMDSVKSFTKQ